MICSYIAVFIAGQIITGLIIFGEKLKKSKIMFRNPNLVYFLNFKALRIRVIVLSERPLAILDNELDERGAIRIISDQFSK